MGFGKTLSGYRKRYGIRQDHFAERVHINRSHLNQIEKEKVSPPKLETVLLMIDVLNLNGDETVDLLIALLHDAGRLSDAQGILALANEGKLDERLKALEKIVRAFETLQAQLKTLQITDQQEILV